MPRAVASLWQFAFAVVLCMCAYCLVLSSRVFYAASRDGTLGILLRAIDVKNVFYVFYSCHVFYVF